MTNTVTTSQAFVIVAEDNPTEELGPTYPTLAAAETALASMAVGSYMIIAMTTATVTAPVAPPAPGVPRITGFAPNSGPVGTKLTFDGVNLSGATAVKIGALQFLPDSSTPTTVLLTVPAGAVTGNVAVQTPGGWTFNNSLFTVMGSVTPLPPVKPLVPSTSVPVIAVTPLIPPASGMKFWKAGNGVMVDENGATLYVEGGNLTGLENTAVQGWDAPDYWGDSGFPAMPPVSVVVNKWGAEIVRVPYNTSSALGLVCVDGEGKTVTAADPAGNYLSYLDNVAMAYTAAGCYVIFVQHWSAPKLALPNYPNGAYLLPDGQGPMADTSTSPYIIKYLAKRFSKFTNVALEGFNENFLGTNGGGAMTPNDVNGIALAGGTASEFINNSDGGADYVITANWNPYGWQQFVTDARNAGFTGPLIIGTPQYDQDLSAIGSHMPIDSLKNLAVAWHYYPAYGTVFGTPAYNLPNYGANGSTAPSSGIVGNAFDWCAAVQALGYPVMATEFGGQNSAGTVGEPFTTAGLTYFKSKNIINCAWAFMVAENANNVLCADVNGTPTPGFGEVVFASMSAQGA